MAFRMMLALLVIALIGCGSPGIKSNQVAESSIKLDSGSFSITKIPLPEEIQPRSIAVDTGKVNGADFETKTIPPLKVVANGTSAEFSPNWNGKDKTDFALALYAINLKDAYGGRFLTLNWELAPNPSNLAIALSRSSVNSWQWLKPSGYNQATLDNIARYLSSNGNMLIIIAITGETKAILKSIEITGTPPVAVLNSSPVNPVGYNLTKVYLDASTSSSINGNIVDYEWDLDGDKVFNEADNGESSFKGKHQAELVPSTSEVHQVKVMVTDEAGLTSTAFLSVGNYVDQGLGLEKGVTDIMGYGEDTVFTGTERIFFSGVNQGSDHYLKSVTTKNSQTDWESTLVLDKPISSIQMIDATLINKTPCVVYSTIGAEDGVVFVRAQDPLGHKWNTPVKVIDTAWFDPIVIIDVNGTPVVSCVSDEARCIVRAKNPEGTEWDKPIEIGPQNVGGGPTGHCSIAIINGNPAMIYRTFDGMTEVFSLMYSCANDAQGSTWSKPIVIASQEEKDTSAEVYDKPALTSFLNFPPVITYINGSDFNKTRNCITMYGLDNDGNSWSSPVNLDPFLEKPERTHSSIKSLSDETQSNVETNVSAPYEDGLTVTNEMVAFYSYAKIINADSNAYLNIDLEKFATSKSGSSVRWINRYFVGKTKLNGYSPKILSNQIEVADNFWVNIHVIVQMNNDKGETTQAKYTFKFYKNDPYMKVDVTWHEVK